MIFKSVPVSEVFRHYFQYGSMCFLAANIITDMLPSLSEEDLLDLFPGPEPFFRRRAIWRIAHVENEVIF